MSEENVFKLMIIDDNVSIHHDFIKILKTDCKVMENIKLCKHLNEVLVPNERLNHVA